MNGLSIAVSALALVVSMTTLWLTFLRKGDIRMTKPTVIFFGPDGGEKGISKIFLRTLLYCTSKRGIVLENLYVRLRRGETQQNFNIWVYGEGPLARGSGLYVSNEGFATNHHFLTPSDVATFEFVAGQYRIEVFAKIVGRSKVKLLSTIDVEIQEHEASKLRDPGFGIYFDWGPDAGRYHAHLDKRSRKETDPLALLEALHKGASEVSKPPQG